MHNVALHANFDYAGDDCGGSGGRGDREAETKSKVRRKLPVFSRVTVTHKHIHTHEKCWKFNPFYPTFMSDPKGNPPARLDHTYWMDWCLDPGNVVKLKQYIDQLIDRTDVFISFLPLFSGI